MAERRVILDYVPRGAFKEFHNRKQRWACLVAHRRAGKTVSAVNDIIRGAFMSKSPNPLFGYIAPYRSQAKSVAWDYIKRYAAPITKAANEADLTVELYNGSKIRLFGADNADAMRGLGFDGIYMDEYGDFKPSVWGHVIRPTLSDKQGWAVFGGTPKGKNQFWEVHQMARLNPKEWFNLTLKASQSGILPQSELMAVQKQISEDQYMQEYECSFEAAILGAFYGIEMREATEEKRVNRVEYDPSLPTFTAWDLGYRDDTAIWWYQVMHKEIHVIDYHSVSGAGIKEIAEVVMSKPYHYAKHFLPHDARAKTLAAQGKSIVEQLGGYLGMSNLAIVPELSVQDGIQAVRQTLPRCWFDELKCLEGIEALRQYQREYDEDKKSYRASPRHDWTSHPCLVAGTMIETATGAVAIEDIKPGDMVVTPAGLSRVLNSGPTKKTNKIIEIKAGYAFLKCTPEHKIFTSRGLLRADALRNTDRIFSGKEWQCRLIGLFSKVSPIGFRDAITGEMSGGAKDRRTYTGLSGRTPMGQFQTGIMSTTSTATPSTTFWPTSDAWNEANTFASTLLSGLRTDHSPHQTLKLDALPLSGTLAPLGMSGTSSMERMAGKIGSGIQEIATAAVSSISRLILRVPGSAMSIVSSSFISPNEAEQLVYDLTVEKNACYQANGILVSNCDAFRMLAISWRHEPPMVKASYDRPLIVGPENRATLNDMWASRPKIRRNRI